MLQAKSKIIALGILAILLASCGTAEVAPAAPPTPLSPTMTPQALSTATPHPEPSEPSVPPEAEASLPEADPETGRQANADVIFIKASRSAGGAWTFNVTVSHPDTGWDDYADGWDVVLPDGMVVKPSPGDPFTRLLLHPHETEQPFTRSQSNIEIPAEVTTVTVRAHDLVDGWGGQEIVVDLTRDSGDGYEVAR